MKKQPKEITKKILSVMLCILTLLMGMPMPLSGQSVNRETQKDTASDLNAFIDSCSLEERIQLMQALGGLKDYKLEEDYFGNLQGLPSLNTFATNKKEASATKPLKPENFNEVLPVTVSDAIAKKKIDENIVSRESICKRLNSKTYWLSWMPFCYYSDEINYHEDVVKWVAKEKGIEKDVRNTLSTFQLERKIVEKYFEEIWDELTVEQRNELLSKIEKDTNSVFENKAAIAGMSGAAAIGVLSTTVAFTGFALYTTMSTVICTVAGILGVTLPFAAYTATTSTVAALAGPVGWAIAGVLLVGSGIIISLPKADNVTTFVMVLHAIKASR